ncbi:MAG: response regulator [Bacteroidia bacterium]|nr:response regulator [Bacteroidia bacterium]
MKKLKVMIVEDEMIVAKDLQRILKKLNYETTDPFASGAKALEQLEFLRPDFILLDINLKGDMDGIQLADHIMQNYGIPFVFITAFSDKATLNRAKMVEPYGYIIKPFGEDDIRTTIELALYKHSRDLEQRSKSNTFADALDNIEQGIIITDAMRKIIFINRTAEALSGSSRGEVLGNDIESAMKYPDDVAKTNFLKLFESDEKNNGQQSNVMEIMFPGKSGSNKIIVNAFPVNTSNQHNSGMAIVLTTAGKQNSETESHTEKNLMSFLENIYSTNGFFVKKDAKFVRVNFKDILFIEAMDNYVILKITGGEQYVLHSSMKDIESRVPQLTFARVHRSYIVQIDKIQSIEENLLVVEGNRIPVGKSYKDTLMDRLNLF